MNRAYLFGNKDAIGMASWIGCRLVQSHYFIDGNKRVALATMLNFLKSNGCSWENTSGSFFYDLIMFIAQNKNEDPINEVEAQIRETIHCI